MASRLRISTVVEATNSFCVMCVELIRDAGGSGFVAIGDHHVGAACGGQVRYFAANAAASADDECDAAAEFFLGRLTAELGLFHRPVFDAEGFDRRKRDVVAEGLEAGRVHALAALRKRARDFAFGQEALRPR